jgi:hypothetical protein
MHWIWGWLTPESVWGKWRMKHFYPTGTRTPIPRTSSRYPDAIPTSYHSRGINSINSNHPKTFSSSWRSRMILMQILTPHHYKNNSISLPFWSIHRTLHSADKYLFQHYNIPHPDTWTRYCARRDSSTAFLNKFDNAHERPRAGLFVHNNDYVVDALRRIKPLLSNDGEISIYTTAVAK